MMNNNGFNFVDYAMEQAQTLTKLWMDSVARMTGAAFAVTPGASPPEMARQMRDSYMSAMGQTMESYMRSEPFLQMLKQSTDMAMEMRKQYLQSMTQWQHSTGAAAYEDVRSLMQGMRYFEERLTRRLDRLSDRLETALNALESRENDPDDKYDDEHNEEENGSNHSTSNHSVSTHSTSPKRMADPRRSVNRSRKPRSSR